MTTALRSLRDFVALTKPGVTRMCLLMTAGGLVLAPGTVDVGLAIFTLLGTACAVGGANTINMWWERDVDRLMSRTRRRPVAAGRIAPAAALRFGLGLVLASVLFLGLGANLLAAVVSTAAAAAYVLVYTPLKRRTPLALVIGAVPGAAPPLVGWAAASGELPAPAWILFGILLVWQIPHFLAIALFRKEDYAKAGIKVVPVVRGDAIAKIQAVAWAMLLVPLSLLLAQFGIGGTFYFVSALLLGTLFLGWSFTGLDNNAGKKWARGFFLASLVYLPALTLALALDSVL